MKRCCRQGTITNATFYYYYSTSQVCDATLRLVSRSKLYEKCLIDFVFFSTVNHLHALVSVHKIRREVTVK